ncbi:MAG: hypothetical protein ABI203_09105, partial [Mucilaginibacter sp.]
TGVTRLISTADGVPGIVNSVGFEGGTVISPKSTATSLMIATDLGICFYDINTGLVTSHSFTANGLSKIFQATYRTEMYKDSSATLSNAFNTDTIQYLPEVVQLNSQTVVSFLWEGGNWFGYNINTADYLSDALYGNEVFSRLIWGNKRGMFQNYLNHSNNSSTSPSAHYLDNIKVNKIADIYGLVAFGSPGEFSDPGLIKQNLLIGTDQGLYFSSSIYQKFTNNNLNAFSLFHDDDLGNIVINDICVNTTQTLLPMCEDGAWIAANDGLYLIKPDYAKYLNNQKLQSISFQGKDNSVSESDVCVGSFVTAELNVGVYTGYNETTAIQWYKNGVAIQGQTQATLDISTAGDFYALLYDPCGNIHIESNHLTTKVISLPTFTFNYPDKLQYCMGTPLTLTPVGSTDYLYRWYKDGVLTGDVAPALPITQSGKYKVEVSACTGSWVASKEVAVDFILLPTPVVATDKTVYCAGDNATVSIATTDDPSYTINWYRDNVLLTVYKNLTSFS